MKIGIISQPNAKGQIVIPKKIRDALGIEKDSLLNLLLKEEGFYVHPIVGVSHKTQTDNTAFLKILRETQGAWGKASQEELKKEKKQRRLELQAAKSVW